MPVVVGGNTEGEEGGWTEHQILSTCVHVQVPGVFLDDTEQPCSIRLQAVYSLCQDDDSVHFWEETAVGSPLRGQFIARHEGRVAWVKMLGSEDVKSLAGYVFLSRTS